MRRSALLILTGLTLVCFSGCHSHWWHRKHHQGYEYAEYNACGCDGAYAGTLDPGPIPLSHTITSSPGVYPAATSGGIPGPPGALGAATPAPPGTKVLNPTNK